MQKCKTDSLTFSLFHFSPLTFKCCQFGTPLDLSYLLTLSEPKRCRFGFFFFFFFGWLKKIKKTVIKKKNHFFFSFSLSSDFLSLSHSLSVWLTMPWCKASPPPLASTHYSSQLVLELGAGFIDDEKAIIVELLEQSKEGDFVEWRPGSVYSAQMSSIRRGVDERVARTSLCLRFKLPFIFLYGSFPILGLSSSLSLSLSGSSSGSALLSQINKV